MRQQRRSRGTGRVCVARDGATRGGRAPKRPHDAAGATEGDFAELQKICADPNVVAVGECGLDFHYDRSPRDVQRDVFVRQLRLAKQVVHVHRFRAGPGKFESMSRLGITIRAGSPKDQGPGFGRKRHSVEFTHFRLT